MTAWAGACLRDAPSPWCRICLLLRDEAVARLGVGSGVIAVRELDVAPKELSRWCCGHREPPMWALRRLAELAGRAIVVLPSDVFLVALEDLEARTGVRR